MAEAVVLNAQDRQGNGTRLARKLRKNKQIPAILYGHGEATLPLTLPGDEISRLVRHGVRIVDLKTSKGTEKALLREVQYDHLGMEILHVDFARVSADERILIDVRVELRGTAPGIAQGGTIQQPLHNLHVECLAIAIPDSIRVPLGELQLNQAIHVKDLKLPEGVVVKNDPDAIVVQCTPQIVEAAAPGEAVPGSESAEPEVIGRAKAEEESEAE
jgi:large subunit ribosomal protein L25